MVLNRYIRSDCGVHLEKKQILLNLAVSIALFAALFYLIGADKIVHVLSAAKPEFFALALIVYASVTFVMSYRVKVVLASMGEKLSLAQVAPHNLAGLLASDFTPARIGYFFTAFSLSSQYKIKLEKTFIAIFGPQLFDFLIKAISAAALTVLIVQHTGTSNILLNVVVVVAAIAAVLFAGLLVFHPPTLKRFVFLETLPFVSRAFNFIRRMHQHSDRILTVKVEVVCLTLTTWALKGLEWLLLSLALGITVSGDPLRDLAFMMVLQGALTIIQFIPSPTLAGAGASEAAFAIVLIPFGVPFESSVAFGFLTRMSMIIVDSFSLPVIINYLHGHTIDKTMDEIGRMEH